MNPSVLCMFGVVCLGFAVAGNDLWESAPSIGWILALFFFSAAIFTTHKKRKQ